MQMVQIITDKHHAIGCNLYTATGSDKVLVIVSATGVLQSFYRKIAEFFQGKGISTITFDYTGIGKSLQGNIRDEKCRLLSWGNRDLEAVIKYAIETFPGHKLILLGHSIGGQLIGLAPSSLKADKIVLVAAQSGYWKFWKGVSRLRVWVYWYLLIPVLTKGFGFFPSKKFSRMENLPKNIAEEWANWCRSRNYLFDGISADDLYFDRIKCELTSISIEDDFFAPKKSVEWMTERFSGAPVKRLHFFPASFKTVKIGHFSPFTEKFKDTIWTILLEEANN